MPYYSQHKEIAAFIGAVDQVLNSATVLIERELNKQTDIIAYVDEAFRSGKFYSWMMDALGEDFPKSEPPLLNIQFRLLPFSFGKFKQMLEEMLSVKRSPYQIDLAQDHIRLLVDDFIESTVNAGQERSHLQRTEEIETAWRFYCLPRHDPNAWSHEIDYPGTDEGGLCKASGESNTGNYLSDYFYNLYGDAFLVFHNGHKVYFLLTNGSD